MSRKKSTKSSLASLEELLPSPPISAPLAKDEALCCCCILSSKTTVTTESVTPSARKTTTTKKPPAADLPPLVETSVLRHISTPTKIKKTHIISANYESPSSTSSTSSSSNSSSTTSSTTTSLPTLPSSPESSLPPSPRDEEAEVEAAVEEVIAVPKTFGSKAERRQEKLEESFMCPVCWQSIDLTDSSSIYSFRDCGHTYCKQCVRVHLEIKILNGSAGDLHCIQPGCDTKITDAELGDIVDKNTYEKNIEFARIATLQANENCRYCPGCSHPAIYSPDDWKHSWPRVTCENCALDICVECKTTWHPNQRCEDTKKTPEQLALEKWASENFAEFCPRCGCLTQKMHGCDWVKCIACKHEFCFACLEPHNHRANHKHGPRYDPDKVRRYEAAWAKRHPKLKIVMYSALGIVGITVGAIVIAVSPLLILRHVVKTVHKNVQVSNQRRKEEKGRTNSSKSTTQTAPVAPIDLTPASTTTTTTTSTTPPSPPSGGSSSSSSSSHNQPYVPF